MPQTKQQLYNNKLAIGSAEPSNLASVVAAMQTGGVGGVNGVPLSQGFGASTVPFDAQNIGFVQTTTSATALTPTTVNYNVPNSPSTFLGTAWVAQGNGFVVNNGLSYNSATGVLTITVASNATSQALNIAVWNGSNSNVIVS